MTAMMTAFVPPPVRPDTSAAREEENQDRVPDLTKEDGDGMHLVRPERVRPEPS